MKLVKVWVGNTHKIFQLHILQFPKVISLSFKGLLRDTVAGNGVDALTIFNLVVK